MDAKVIKAAEITNEIIEQEAAPWKQAAEVAKAAATAYMEDITARKAALENRSAEYQKQADNLREARKKAASLVTDLTSRGRFDEAAEEELNLEKLDETISMLERKLRLVSSAELKGDPKLYADAKEANEAMAVYQVPYIQNIDAMCSVVADEIERLQKLQKELSFARDRNFSFYANQAFEKVDRHYRDLDRIEREAKERWEKEQTASREDAEKGRRIRRVVFPE